MVTVGIFTVKKLCLHQGKYYTYGGFGEYLAAMRARFDKVVLLAHVKQIPPAEGHYVIPHDDHFEVVHLPSVKSELGVLVTLPVMLWRSWGAVRRVDIVHARMPDYTGVIGAFICRLRKVPFFCQIIDDWELQARRIPITRKYGLGLLLKVHLYVYDFLERLACRGQLVFAQGDTCFEKHRKHSDCELVFSSSHHLFEVVTPPQRFCKTPHTILIVARLTGVKNQQLALRAVARLRSEGEEWRAVLLGEGPSRRELEELAQKLGLRLHVIFAGQVVRGPTLWRYFDEADCMLLSSRSEGTPKVLLEAMARGLPVVASKVAGVPSILGNDERGLLFRDNDVESLVSVLRRVATEPSLRQRIVSEAHEFAKRHTVEETMERMLQKVFARWPRLRPATAPTSTG
jgi:glycosyltransferase involved in cell wall biosynthesis